MDVISQLSRVIALMFTFMFKIECPNEKKCAFKFF